jgi:REP element-mobilizing transposase RayT
MANHVHLLIDTSTQLPEDFAPSTWETLDYESLSSIMKRIKGPSAMYANRLLKRSGKFWQRESYDHYLRSRQELPRIVNYILQNPVKARLVREWDQFPYTYLSESARQTWLV